MVGITTEVFCRDQIKSCQISCFHTTPKIIHNGKHSTQTTLLKMSIKSHLFLASQITTSI